MELPNAVGPYEHLARFLTQTNHFSPQSNSVKPRVFEPPDDLRLSVFRVDGLDRQEVWAIGQTNVISRMPPPRKTLYGMADILAFLFEGRNLHVDPDNNPPRHANITGWPEAKSERKLIAQELAVEATLVLRSASDRTDIPLV